MSITGKLILAVLATVAIAIFVVPVLALIGFVAVLTGFFGAAVVLWAVVLLGERWMDEGLDGYNYLDALDNALQDVFQGIRRTFRRKDRESLRERLGAFLPLLAHRGAVVIFWTISPAVYVVSVFRDGHRATINGMKTVWSESVAHWRGLYL